MIGGSGGNGIVLRFGDAAVLLSVTSSSSFAMRLRRHHQFLLSMQTLGDRFFAIEGGFVFLEIGLITEAAIGAAAAPWQTCSPMTATTIFGSFTGAKPTNKPLWRSWNLRLKQFWVNLVARDIDDLGGSGLSGHVHSRKVFRISRSVRSVHHAPEAFFYELDRFSG